MPGKGIIDLILYLTLKVYTRVSQSSSYRPLGVNEILAVWIKALGSIESELFSFHW